MGLFISNKNICDVRENHFLLKSNIPPQFIKKNKRIFSNVFAS